MTFGGNIKQRVAFWAAVASFIAAVLGAVEYTTTGADGYKALAVGAFMLGIIFFAGVWALGLTKPVDPSEEEWMNSIR
ncbi:hypothetical protein J7I84_08765 [Arthrobacter sp. ISL-85]|uniref:hypothetical protein n=1 Tax=Arthrobacter sp. ISL-85 TaxID=2819115 RepID=UPI001BEC4F3A|nr:hypothetical protein [Arthrobacter sp. ISL-85]MBT2566583.1 hypothetical protein [Arthrobacter sp. ISL-85]